MKNFDPFRNIIRTHGWVGTGKRITFLNRKRDLSDNERMVSNFWKSSTFYFLNLDANVYTHVSQTATLHKHPLHKYKMDSQDPCFSTPRLSLNITTTATTTTLKQKIYQNKAITSPSRYTTEIHTAWWLILLIYPSGKYVTQQKCAGTCLPKFWEFNVYKSGSIIRVTANLFRASKTQLSLTVISKGKFRPSLEIYFLFHAHEEFLWDPKYEGN